MIDSEFLAILACPVCPDRPSLELDGDFLLCKACKHRFPIVNGIPHLIADEAVPAKDKDKDA